MWDTSVFRFCKTMNLKGYQEFKMMLSLSLHEGDGKDMERLAGNISLEDSFEELSQKVLNTNINALTETFSLPEYRAFPKSQLTILDRRTESAFSEWAPVF